MLVTLSFESVCARYITVVDGSSEDNQQVLLESSVHLGFNFVHSHQHAHAHFERTTVGALRVRCSLNGWMERLARVTAWTERACMKCNFPYQDGLIEAPLV